MSAVIIQILKPSNILTNNAIQLQNQLGPETKP